MSTAAFALTQFKDAGQRARPTWLPSRHIFRLRFVGQGLPCLPWGPDPFSVFLQATSKSKTPYISNTSEPANRRLKPMHFPSKTHYLTTKVNIQ